MNTELKATSLFAVKLSYLVFFVIMITVNYFYQGKVSAISQLNKPFIQPANFTFMIWSIIYGWLLCWIIYSFFKKNNDRQELYWSLKYLLPLNFTLNTLWILAYTSKQSLLAVVFIALVWLTNLLMYLKTRKYKSLGWFNIGVFSVYLGWITVATMVNLFSYINNITPAVWINMQQTIVTTIVLFILFLFSIYMLTRYNDVLLPLTIVWALIGITFNKANSFISIFSIALAILIVFITIFVSIKKNKLLQ